MSIDNNMNCKVTIFAPLESVGAVWCDYGGLWHIQIDDKEFVTDEATYWLIINARSMLRIKTPNEKEEDESQECYFKWSLADNGWADHTCSKCGFVENTDIHVVLDWNYCPNCGRKVVFK